VNGRNADTGPLIGSALVGRGSSQMRVFGRVNCIDCKVGAAHARGDIVPVERMTWKRAAAAVEKPIEPPRTEVPRVDGVLDPKTATRKAARAEGARPERNEPNPAPEPAPEHEERPMSAYLARRTELQTRRDAVIIDVLEKKLSIHEYSKKHGIDQATLRWWLSHAGHDPKAWPRSDRVASAAAAAKTKAVAREAKAELRRIQEEVDAKRAASLGDVIHEPKPLTLEGEVMPPPEPTPRRAPRAMDRTELELDEPIPYRPTLPALSDMLMLPVEVAVLFARLKISSSIVHVAQLLYMVGHSHGRGAADDAGIWLERARNAMSVGDA
jgi:transposase-like protein